MGRVCESPCRWIGKPLSSETCRGVWTMNEVEDLMRLMRHWKRSFFSDPIEHIIAVLRFAHYNFFSAFILNTLHTMQWKKCKQLKVLFYYLYYPRHKLKNTTSSRNLCPTQTVSQMGASSVDSSVDYTESDLLLAHCAMTHASCESRV